MHECIVFSTCLDLNENPTHSGTNQITPKRHPTLRAGGCRLFMSLSLTDKLPALRSGSNRGWRRAISFGASFAFALSSDGDGSKSLLNLIHLRGLQVGAGLVGQIVASTIKGCAPRPLYSSQARETRPLLPGQCSTLVFSLPPPTRRPNGIRRVPEPIK